MLAVVSAYGGADVAIVQDGEICARRRITAEHRLAGALPALVGGLIDEAGAFDLVAVVVGPGSFTGLRAGLSVAHGIALGAHTPIVGVTVAEALAEAAGPALDGRQLWTAIVARAGRVFIDRDGGIAGHAIASLPAATGRVALCGNAANDVAAILAARGTDVMLTAFRAPAPDHVAAVALRRLRDGPPIPAALPLYVDAPEARPAANLRAPPVTAGMA